MKTYKHYKLRPEHVKRSSAEDFLLERGEGETRACVPVVDLIRLSDLLSKSECNDINAWDAIAHLREVSDAHVEMIAGRIISRLKASGNYLALWSLKSLEMLKNIFKTEQEKSGMIPDQCGSVWILHGRNTAWVPDRVNAVLHPAVLSAIIFLDDGGLSFSQYPNEHWQFKAGDVVLYSPRLKMTERQADPFRYLIFLTPCDRFLGYKEARGVPLAPMDEWTTGISHTVQAHSQGAGVGAVAADASSDRPDQSIPPPGTIPTSITASNAIPTAALAPQHPSAPATTNAPAAHLATSAPLAPVVPMSTLGLTCALVTATVPTASAAPPAPSALVALSATSGPSASTFPIPHDAPMPSTAFSDANSLNTSTAPAASISDSDFVTAPSTVAAQPLPAHAELAGTTVPRPLSTSATHSQTGREWVSNHPRQPHSLQADSAATSVCLNSGADLAREDKDSRHEVHILASEPGSDTGQLAGENEPMEDLDINADNAADVDVATDTDMPIDVKAPNGKKRTHSKLTVPSSSQEQIPLGTRLTQPARITTYSRSKVSFTSAPAHSVKSSSKSVSKDSSKGASLSRKPHPAKSSKVSVIVPPAPAARTRSRRKLPLRKARASKVTARDPFEGISSDEDKVGTSKGRRKARKKSFSLSSGDSDEVAISDDTEGDEWGTSDEGDEDEMDLRTSLVGFDEQPKTQQKRQAGGKSIAAGKKGGEKKGRGHGQATNSGEKAGTKKGEGAATHTPYVCPTPGCGMAYKYKGTFERHQAQGTCGVERESAMNEVSDDSPDVPVAGPSTGPGTSRAAGREASAGRGVTKRGRRPGRLVKADFRASTRQSPPPASRTSAQPSLQPPSMRGRPTIDAIPALTVRLPLEPQLVIGAVNLDGETQRKKGNVIDTLAPYVIKGFSAQ